MRRACLLLLLAGCMKPPDAASGLVDGPDAGRFLTVIGTGRLLASPTRVDVDAIVVTEAPAAAAAWQGGADRIFKLARQLEAVGVLAEDMIVQEGHLNRAEATYRFEQRLRITVRNPKAVVDVLTRAMAAGANRVEGARFALADGRPSGDRARERALLDAHDKAEALAQELQLRLGAVRSVEELPGSTPTESSTLDAAPTALEAVSELRVTYQLLD